jgi:hypothetical protein
MIINDSLFIINYQSFLIIHQLSSIIIFQNESHFRPMLGVEASGMAGDHTGRGIHGLPKVSCGPCRRATPQTALRSYGLTVLIFGSDTKLHS